MKQLIILTALVAVSSAVVIGPPAYSPYGPAIAKIASPLGYPAYPAIAKVAAPLIAKVAAPEPYDPNPQYSYSYDVHVSSSRTHVIGSTNTYTNLSVSLGSINR